MAIHPAQVPVINEVFTPTPAAVAKARAVVAAFDANPGKGTVGIDGVMYDRPHLERARQLLARATAAGRASVPLSKFGSLRSTLLRTSESKDTSVDLDLRFL